MVGKVMLEEIDVREVDVEEQVVAADERERLIEEIQQCRRVSEIKRLRLRVIEGQDEYVRSVWDEKFFTLCRNRPRYLKEYLVSVGGNGSYGKDAEEIIALNRRLDNALYLSIIAFFALNILCLVFYYSIE